MERATYSSSATAPSAPFCSDTILDSRLIEPMINPLAAVTISRSSKTGDGCCIHGAGWNTREARCRQQRFRCDGLFRKIRVGQCLSTRKGGLRLPSNLSCLDAAVLSRVAKLPTGCQRPRGKAAASVINAADALARYVCRSRCAAIGDGFGVRKIRRPAKSSPLPLAVEGESCRRPPPALGVSSQTARRPCAAGAPLHARFIGRRSKPSL